MGSSVASSVRDGPLAQENGGKSVREYSYRAPSDVSGGSANSFAQNLSSAMLHDIVSQLAQQALDLETQRRGIEQQRLDSERQRLDMENQSREIAELKQKLALAKPSLEQSEREKEVLRKRSEAYRKPVSRRIDLSIFLARGMGSESSLLSLLPRLQHSGCGGEIFAVDSPQICVSSPSMLWPLRRAPRLVEALSTTVAASLGGVSLACQGR